MPSPRMPASPREAPSTVQADSLPVAVASRAVRPPGAAVQREPRARRGLDRQPGQARHAHALVRLQAQRDLAARRRARRPRSSPPSGHHRRRLPAQPRGQPAEQQQPGDRRVGAVAHGDGADRGQLGAPAGRVEGGGDALAPRRASAARPGRRRRRAPPARRARRERPVRRRARRPSRAARPGPCAAARPRASWWPWGDQTTVGRSVTTSGSTIVSRRDRCCGPRSSTTCSWATASRPGSSIVLGDRASPASRSARAPARPRRGRCARRGSARRAPGGCGSRRCHSRSTTTTRFSTRAGA